MVIIVICTNLATYGAPSCNNPLTMVNMPYINNVILVKIEGPVWYTIYHHLPVVKGVSSSPSMKINQWEKDIYVCRYIPIMVGVRP